MYALRTCASVWRSAFTQSVDVKMLEMGVTLLDCPWDDFEYVQGDRDHFTERGFRRFATWLGNELEQRGVDDVRVMSDSTVDYGNWNSDGRRTGQAHRYLYRVLKSRGIRATLDSVNGSGYVAEPAFEDRLPRRRTDPRRAVLVIGGWNDRHHAPQEVHAAIESFWSRRAREE